MIVRTYARRNRCISRTLSDSSFDGGIEESLSQETSQDPCALTFSSQDSSLWSLDSDALPAPTAVRKSKKKQPKNPNSSVDFRRTKPGSVPTSTLMEAQEFGEMMEHMDEVNFALDGLRPGHLLRIRRASLLSLLSICATAQQRRLLRTQGMAKTIIDSILSLTIDDYQSTLAAATLFYVLANDGQDEHLLDSPSCVNFLLRLLSSSSLDVVEDKAPTLGSRLLALRKDPGTSTGFTKKLDSSSTAIISKVQEILLSCKELKPKNRHHDGSGRPELSPKWIALLTMEKACLSTVSLEDTSGTVRRVGGKFKERLRELGGLDAVFDVISNCHSIMKGWLKNVLSLSQELKDDVAMGNVALLLKCLKIMENATFLSKENQNHLLGMDAKFDNEGLHMSFVGLILSAIKILSGISLLQNSSCTLGDEKSNGLICGEDAQYCNSSKVHLKGNYNEVLCSSSSGRFCNTERASDVKSSKRSQKRQRLCLSQSEHSLCGSATTLTSDSDVYSIMRGGKSLSTVQCRGTLRCSNEEISISVNEVKINSEGLCKRSHAPGGSKYELEDSQDPFAFDEDDMEPSKWEILSTKNSAYKIHQSMKADRKWEGGCELALVTRNCDSINQDNHPSCESSSSSLSEEDNDLLDDCLLTAVKVLMNLTNDNPIGCQQIASCGGLDTMATLITCHFPSFDSCLSIDCQMLEDISFSQLSTDSDHQNDRHLSDQELDFLVAILGLLVNLVEKDSQNRSRLAAATVPLPRSGLTEGKDSHRDVISLLCSIFLANQGSGEATGEGRQLEWDDEDALLQGEREAEKMIIEAYAALLLAFLSTESLDVREAIADCLPDGKLEVLIPVLERFVAFHLTLNMISPETHAAVREVIESCRGP